MQGVEIGLLCLTASSPALVIFTHFKFCLSQSYTVPTTTQCPLPFLF